MKNKGQISVFIIIAIVFAVTISAFFLFETNLQEQSFKETGNIKNFVENCIKETGLEITYEIGKYGGYYFPAEVSTDSGIAIYYSNGKTYVPLKSDIEKEISFYLEKKLFFCIKNFQNFPDLEIKHGETKVNTEIEQDKILFNIEYPLSITKGKNTITIDKFNAEIPIRLGILYDSAYEYIKGQSKNEGICLTCLLNLSLKNYFYADLLDYDDGTVVFILRDEKSKINNETFKWIFANKYNTNEAKI